MKRQELNAAIKAFQNTRPDFLGQGRDVRDEEVYNALVPVIGFEINYDEGAAPTLAYQQRTSSLLPEENRLRCPPTYTNGETSQASNTLEFFNALLHKPEGDRDASEKGESLLWHGTNLQAALEIVQYGFRMPVSGRRFGRGLYFADDVGKSDQYTTLHHPEACRDFTLDSSYNVYRAKLMTKLSLLLSESENEDIRSMRWLLACRVTLGCVAKVTLETYGFGKAIPKTEEGLPVFVDGAKGTTLAEPFNSLNLINREEDELEKRYRYSEFVVYDPALALPMALIGYKRVQREAE